MATIITKTGSKALMLEPRESLYRRMAITPNWRALRLNASLSFCGMSSDNSAPNSETVSRTGYLDDFFFGFSDSAVLPGGAGVRGMTWAPLNLASAVNVTMTNATGWKPLNNANHGGVTVWNNGAAFRKSYAGFSTMNNFPASWDPTASSLFAFFMTVDFRLGYSGGVPTILSFGSSGNTFVLRTGVSELNLLSDIAAATGVTANSTTVTATNGWWDTSIGAGLQYLCIRNPYYTNRLRIHAIRAVQLA